MSENFRRVSARDAAGVVRWFTEDQVEFDHWDRVFAERLVLLRGNLWVLYREPSFWEESKLDVVAESYALDWLLERNLNPPKCLANLLAERSIVASESKPLGGVDDNPPEPPLVANRPVDEVASRASHESPTKTADLARSPSRANPATEFAKPVKKEPHEAVIANHSPDFRSVNWEGMVFSFTPGQAAVVKVLFNAWQIGAPDVGDSTLLDAVDREAPPDRLDTFFREHPAWDTMIVKGGTRGSRRLAGRPKIS